jgi:hypothetical protein
MKYAGKIAKKDSFPLSFPLNYLIHSSLLKLYFDDIGANPKSLLVTNFYDMFAKLHGFSEDILGVKAPY